MDKLFYESRLFVIESRNGKLLQPLYVGSSEQSSRKLISSFRHPAGGPSPYTDDDDDAFRSHEDDEEDEEEVSWAEEAANSWLGDQETHD